MEDGPIQKLLLTEEYNDLQDIVLVESVFVELDKMGDGLQIVSLALTPDRLLLAKYNVINYHDDPNMVYDVDRDLTIEGLELKWLAPLYVINICQMPDGYVLKVTAMQCKPRHFELCSCQLIKEAWYKWADRLEYVEEDPYGYIGKQCLRFGDDEKPEDDKHTRSDSDSESNSDSKEMEINSKSSNSSKHSRVKKREKNERVSKTSDTTKHKNTKNIFLRRLLK